MDRKFMRIRKLNEREREREREKPGARGRRYIGMFGRELIVTMIFNAMNNSQID